jgi:hypothetical protein
MPVSSPPIAWRWSAMPRIPSTRWPGRGEPWLYGRRRAYRRAEAPARAGKDIGQHLYLRRYERSRKHSAALMLAGMQGFREMFSGSHPAKKFLRDMGLKLADTLPGVKPQLIRQAMGLNDLPAWLR